MLLSIIIIHTTEPEIISFVNKVGGREDNFSKMRKKDVSRWVPCRPGSKGVELASSVAFVLQANFERKKTLEKKTLKITPWH